MGSAKGRNLSCEARSSCKLHIYVVPDQRHHGQHLAGLTFESAAGSVACFLVLCIERSAQINVSVFFRHLPACSGQRAHVVVTLIPASTFETLKDLHVDNTIRYQHVHWVHNRRTDGLQVSPQRQACKDAISYMVQTSCRFQFFETGFSNCRIRPTSGKLIKLLPYVLIAGGSKLGPISAREVN